ncbi:hypothetical protein [Porphyromonas endodontalis]|uniref:hypothetical protein n=1 Tax=Porphyromonas endodontalis TaxID=28124 RepID=UPI0028E64BA8|nr:hypothetical protein [Porphyromonas endodontalis]
MWLRKKREGILEPWRKKRRSPSRDSRRKTIGAVGEPTTPTFRKRKKRKYVSPSSPQVIAKRAETEEGHGLPSFVWSV